VPAGRTRRKPGVGPPTPAAGGLRSWLTRRPALR